jgi:hypothetical protein
MPFGVDFIKRKSVKSEELLVVHPHASCEMVERRLRSLDFENVTVENVSSSLTDPSTCTAASSAALNHFGKCFLRTTDIERVRQSFVSGFTVIGFSSTVAKFALIAPLN